MPTYTKETALYDTGAISTGITNAGKTASNFLSADSSGIMIYDGESGTQTPSAPSATTNNVFIDSDSVDVRKGTTVLATFGTETEIRTTDGTVLAHIGYATGQAEEGTSVAPYYTFGIRESDTSSTRGNYSFAEGSHTTASGNVSHAEGGYTTASGWFSHAEGYETTASGTYSHAEGYETTANGGYSHAEGHYSIANGSYSHAEGNRTKASGTFSHAEGSYTTASESYSHAEGSHTTASEYASHAEGHYTIANGSYSHAGGKRTVAKFESQTVIGRYNAATVTGSGTDADPYEYSNVGNYAFIIGNGTDNTTADRSNALTVDWNGVVDAAGGYTAGSNPLLTTRTVSVDNVSIVASASSAYSQQQLAVTSITGYTPIGVIGWAVGNASSSGVGASYISVYQAYLAGDHVNFYVRNHSSSAVKVKLTATVLYANTGII